MSTFIFRSICEPIRDNLSFQERWREQDRGLIVCWEIGRQLSIESPDLAIRAKNGELPILVWKGGVDRLILKKEKFGSLNYLAQWQGLRGEDLNIDLTAEVEIICVRTGVKVIFTGDHDKYSEQ